MFRLIKTTSPQQFCSRAVEFLVERIQAAQRDHGTCIIGLSGGRTPRAVYEKLRMQNAKCKIIDWNDVRFFLVDERYVPPDHPESNQRLVREMIQCGFGNPLFRSDDSGIVATEDTEHSSSGDHFVCPNTTLPIDACIADYTRRLKELWKDHLPDLIILGMGTDGHIASLFPPLSDQAMSCERLVLHTRAPESVGPPSARDRISLSLNALAAAGEQVLLLQGKEKRQTWEEMMASPEDERRWPLKRIMETGKLMVIL